MNDLPVNVEVDDPYITALWPLASKVEIIEELPEGGAKVQVKLKSGLRVGRISAETYAARDDWESNLRFRVRRALKATEALEEFGYLCGPRENWWKHLNRCYDSRSSTCNYSHFRHFYDFLEDEINDGCKLTEKSQA